MQVLDLSFIPIAEGGAPVIKLLVRLEQDNSFLVAEVILSTILEPASGMVFFQPHQVWWYALSSRGLGWEMTKNVFVNTTNQCLAQKIGSGFTGLHIAILYLPGKKEDALFSQLASLALSYRRFIILCLHYYHVLCSMISPHRDSYSSK